MSEKPPREPIAIVGIGCRFPGGANDPGSYWALLRDGVDAVTEIPRDRFDADALYREGAPAPGRIGTRWGGFLEGIDRMDAAFFGISPREAERLDPQQRLLLETGWEALEDAGQRIDELAGSRAGVFIGLWLNDFEARLFADEAVDFHMTTGSGRYAASGRISYALGLQGPSVTVDTACSSSLVAVHLACRSLWSGECPLALAGAANVILQPHITIAYSQSGMMAADGRCKFGDARANGYVRSEGAAMLVLKPLSRALADGDRVYAVIRGSAVNNDGRSGDYMATPAQAGQEQMLRLAYADAGVEPGRVGYVEAHGTGTGAGDPVELGALGAVLAEGRPPGRPCAVGSVKTNFGHTEGAAGLAGLIKTALALRHREIPPTLHLQQPNPAIPWSELPLVIPVERTPLPGDGAPTVAGVSSFGIAGTNAHVVLEEAPAALTPRPPLPERERGRTATLLVPLSARSPGALRALAARWAERFADADTPPLEDLAYTAARRRAHLEHRLAVAAHDRAGLVARLADFAAGRPEPDTVAGETRAEAPRVVFVFPGQGSQWVGMGRRLLDREPVFRAALEECDAAMRPFVDWSLLEQLALGESDPGYVLDRIDVVQPTLVSLDIALARLWRSWGIEPAAVVGHSMGEVAAACVAGALSLADAMRVICLRSRLLRRISGQGAMAVVDLPRAEADAALTGFEDRVSVAAANSPRSTILSGEPEALREVLERLERSEVFCRWVNVDVASHSPQVEPLRRDLLEALAGLQPLAPRVPFHSTVLGRLVEGPELDAGYWERNLRQPVLFGDAVQQLAGAGHGAFLEVSPHPVLLPAVQQTLQLAGSDALALGSLRRGEDERAMLLRSLAELFVAGAPVAWARLAPEGRLVALPTYPWQRERFWYEPPARRRTARRGAARHPLLGGPLRTATGPQVWEAELGTAVAPYLADHRVAGRAVVPAAALLELGLSIAEEAGYGGDALEEFRFEEALLLDDADDAGREVQLVVERDSASAHSIQVFSRRAGEDGAEWTRNARGRLVVGDAGPEEPEPPAPVAAPADAAAASAAAREHYRAMAGRGLEYGPAFQVVDALWRTPDGGVAAALRLPAALAPGAEEYRMHPALLDGCLQLVLQTLRADDPPGAYLPVLVRRLKLHRRPEPGATVVAVAARRAGDGDLHGDVRLVDAEGRPLLHAEGVEFRRATAETDEGRGWLERSLYELTWQPAPLVAAPATAVPATAVPATDSHAAAVASRRWLILADSGGVARALASRLEAAGHACTLVARPSGDGRDGGGPDALAGLLRDAAVLDPPVGGIVHLWSLDAAPGDDAAADALEAAQEHGTASVLDLVQAVPRLALPAPPRLWLVTRGAQPIADVSEGALPGLAHAPLWGLAAVLANEHPELRCACVDLDPAPDAADEPLAATLARELLADSVEDRVGYRHGVRYAARLAPAALPAPPEPSESTEVAVPAPYRVTTTGAGVLDNLVVRPAARRRPGRGEVEIEVRAVGLNFMNVMSALGTYPGYPDGLGPLGIECAGVVAAVGPEVADLEPGDAVVAFAFDCLASHAIADARLVARKPARLSFEEAATLPIAFLTASYALEHVGRIEAGERVLVHSAAGGVGLAAVQLARRAGAEVYATAGTPEKREMLRGLGVEHVFDSRTLGFADELLARTGGEGVDLVLNSLAGEAIPKGLSVLRPYGRFLELGKRDIHDGSRFSLAPFRNQLSYSAIDLDHAARRRPALLGRLLREVVARVEAGELTPLPLRVYPVSRAADAFREMAQARHTGKLVIAIEETARSRRPAGPLRADATYLLTGGLGGLGLEVARWMAEAGARQLVLLGRNAPSDAARAALDELAAMGVGVVVESADVGSETELRRVLARIDAELPPLGGVVHAAGVLADATALELDRDRLYRAMAPKLRGAWNLHRLTADRPLDFFVLFSSVAALLGTPGQGNYAAANAFLDALAHRRRAAGLPALGIAWGPWSEVGLAAARAERGGRLAALGLGSISPAQGVAALAELLRHPAPAHLAVARLDAGCWAESHPAAATSPLLGELIRAGAGGADAPGARPDAAVRDAILAAEPGPARLAALEAHLRERAAGVLRLAPERVPVGQPLKALGMDSLMTLELRNRLEADLRISLSATVVWNYPTISLLARHLVGKLDPAQAPPRPAAADDARSAASAAVPASGADASYLELDRQQLESLLDRELAAIDDLLSGS